MFAYVVPLIATSSPPESATTTTVAERSGRKRLGHVVAVAFYTSATLIVWYGLSDDEHKILSDAFVADALRVLPFMSGIAFALAWWTYNPFRFLLLGFAQPLITNVVLVLIGSLTIDTALALGATLFVVALDAAMLVALGGFAASLAVAMLGPKRMVIDITIRDVVGWLSATESNLDRVEKIILRIAAIATTLISAASWLRARL